MAVYIIVFKITYNITNPWKTSLYFRIYCYSTTIFHVFPSCSNIGNIKLISNYCPKQEWRTCGRYDRSDTRNDFIYHESVFDVPLYFNMKMKVLANEERQRNDFVLKWSEVKWVTLKFLGTKVPCTLRWPYNEGTWLYCDYFIWRVSCTVVVLTCFAMCGCVYVWVL